MTAHHFFATPDDVRGDTITLNGDEAHHASRVLRLRVGEAITVSDNTGHVYEADVASIGGHVVAHVNDVRDVSMPRPAITVHQALMKGDRMDDLIDRCVEVGVTRVAPFVGARSIVRWDEARKRKAHARWNEIARAASKQARSPWLAVVDPVADEPPREGFVLHEEASLRLREALPDDPPDELALVVGPEGGFERSEIDGARAVSLGQQVLRSDFAGPVAAAIVAFVYGSLG